MPVIERNELLEVHADCIGVPMQVLMIERHLFLEIQAEGICATNGGFTDSG